MPKRFTVGLNFFFDNQTNSGIVNYIYNIIAALNTLEDAQKPKLFIFYSENAPIEYLKEINYPFIRYELFQRSIRNRYLRKVNQVLKKLINRDLYLNIRYFSKIDCLYPYFQFMDDHFREAPHKIHWLVDFNSRVFKDHYQDAGKSMNNYQENITSQKGEKVILSSIALKNELEMYLPNYKCDISILKFASSIPVISENDIATAKMKYNIRVPYFMSPNQFWQHKNQEVVLKAIKVIKQSNPEFKFKVLFTGSLLVTRGKGRYADHLCSLINEYHVSDYIEFLGVVERKEQIALMKGSIALIQPSLYEGWSTLVEEAKALNQYILLSDLPVHREQTDRNVTFFDPCDENRLAEIMIGQIVNPKCLAKFDYIHSVKAFGETIKRTFIEQSR
jgi:glycosyltransferase involved in cell wall biosynthesis